MSDTSKERNEQADSSASQQSEGMVAKVVQWFDIRLGLSHELLRPAPAYSVNPFYWLGALAVVAFAIQGITGLMMMLYYIPTPTQAYSSTQFIFQNVSYGTFLETVHLYTAYAMIMLAFMHLMRGYFVSVHKKPRELMWIVGMGMGFVTLGFGFTGYLLPWTIVSKSATDVGVGMIDALPQPISNFLSFLIIGGGGAPEELLRFYDLHVVVLPAVLLLLLVGKMYMLETHGVSEPVTGPVPPPPKKQKLVPIFPDMSFYLLELASLFGAVMLLISVAFPLTLAPEYSAALAGQYTPQPDWYFLWIYQILKISVFEGSGLPVALSLVTLIFVALLLLPFIDRGKDRRMASRMKFITVGAIFVAEVAVLAVWGHFTPGAVIPSEQAALVLGGTALLVALVSLACYRFIFRSLAKGAAPLSGVSSPPAPYASRSFDTASLWTAGSFVLMLTVGTLGISGLISSAVSFVAQGYSSGTLYTLGLASAELAVAVLGAVYLLYRLDLGTDSIKRRVRALEVGWKN